MGPHTLCIPALIKITKRDTQAKTRQQHTQQQQQKKKARSVTHFSAGVAVLSYLWKSPKTKNKQTKNGKLKIPFQKSILVPSFFTFLFLQYPPPSHVPLFSFWVRC